MVAAATGTPTIGGDTSARQPLLPQDPPRWPFTSNVFSRGRPLSKPSPAENGNSGAELLAVGRVSPTGGNECRALGGIGSEEVVDKGKDDDRERNAKPVGAKAQLAGHQKKGDKMEKDARMSAGRKLQEKQYRQRMRRECGRRFGGCDNHENDCIEGKKKNYAHMLVYRFDAAGSDSSLYSCRLDVLVSVPSYRRRASSTVLPRLP